MKKRLKYGKLLLVLGALIVIFSLGFPLGFLSGNKQGKVIVNEKVNLPFEIKDNTKIILLYFGYVGCRTVCEPSLKEISSVYDGVADAQRGSVNFYFIDITKSGSMAKEFAHYFNGSFIGLNLNTKSTAKLMADLRAYSSDSITGNGDISHTGYLYLIKQTQKQSFELKTIYITRPFDSVSIEQDITKELK
jgi:protein SCO1/2